MEPPSKDEIREFWEWCGFRWDGEDFPGKGFWLNPNGFSYCWPNEHLTSFELLPHIAPNNLFKFAVPKLKTEFRNWKSVLHDWVDELTGNYEEDTLALFWTIYGVMKSQKGGIEDGN